ncbi:MAG: LON peptidase substrate-binding domain-containing protein [Burkholderiaceae bacterium]
MADPDDWLPLFPLNTVLFPQGVLPLRVFEARYIDMVRDCMKRGAPFGVALIRSGKEVGEAAVPEDVGCLAHIVQWDMQELGVLLLQTEGGARFRIRGLRTLTDQRVEAAVDILPESPPAAVNDAHMRCATALKSVIEDIDAKGSADAGDDFVSPFAKPARLDDAGWVANRWCEILPIPMKARQKLLELDDAQTRLTIVDRYLRQHDIL